MRIEDEEKWWEAKPSHLIPLKRELKLTLLDWLKNGIDSQKLIDLYRANEPNEEKLWFDFYAHLMRRYPRYCHLIKANGDCNPQAKIENYKSMGNIKGILEWIRSKGK